MLFPHNSYLSSLCKCAPAITAEVIQVHLVLLVFRSMFCDAIITGPVMNTSSLKISVFHNVINAFTLLGCYAACVGSSKYQHMPCSVPEEQGLKFTLAR